ncbi:MAG: hypothetical protein K2N28_01060 [Muribaculaceae bacterium]|nr:hypothetical protein [Muribaculaceae bacterium]
MAGSFMRATEARCQSPIDSLMSVLDKAIENRDTYLNNRKGLIRDLKNGLDTLTDPIDIYNRNSKIIDLYESFVSDSAKKYLNENLIIAEKAGLINKVNNTKIRLALIYAMNGQFLKSHDLFDSLDYNSLGDERPLYAWAKLKYLENLMISSDEESQRELYHQERLAWRDSLINMFSEGSDLYRKEVANRCREVGEYDTALAIFNDVYAQQVPESHDAAMVAKALADIYHLKGNEEMHKYYLILSSIADIKQAVKENESLLALAEMMYSSGEIDRAYNYMRVALEDANYYNSSFKNAVIARVYPIVEMSYIEQINAQQHRIKMVMWLVALLAVIMAVIALMFYKQRQTVSRSRADLAKANERLERASVKLAEANLIRERYVGYFMHQCSLNVDKLDKFRINVNRKIKANQVEEVYVMSSRPLEKELDELYENFDRAFLNLYPNFIEEFNNLLQPDYRYALPKGRLNTPVRIFALIRMGITDMTQIAGFLHYSVQTVYNYKSKVRKNSILTSEEFEEKVKKIGTLAQ